MVTLLCHVVQEPNDDNVAKRNLGTELNSVPNYMFTSFEVTSIGAFNLMRANYEIQVKVCNSITNYALGIFYI